MLSIQIAVNSLLAIGSYEDGLKVYLKYYNRTYALKVFNNPTELEIESFIKDLNYTVDKLGNLIVGGIPIDTIRLNICKI